MRILKLNLLRFGAFTDAMLDFSAAPAACPGLHLIHGPNEAGKSTARRGLRFALYGFPHQTDFNFLHDMGSLRIGLTIEDDGGQTQEFIRRKGNKDTFLDAAGEKPISDGLLLRCLAGAGTADEFERAFAIGHEELRTGGEAMLDEDNPDTRNEASGPGSADVSRMIFMAATGLSDIKAIEREFLEDAETLFKPRGSKQAINKGLNQLKDLRDTQRKLEVRSDEYLDLEHKLQQARARHAAHEQELAAAGREQSRLNRLRQAFPTLARLRDRLAEREALGKTPDLGEGFADRRIAIQRDLAIATGEIELIEAQRIEIRDRLDALIIPEDLLASAASIDRLYKSLAIHAKAKRDSETRQGEIGELERQMRGRLQEIGRSLEDLDPNVDLLLSPDAMRIRKLANDRTTAAERLARERGSGDRLREQLQRTEQHIEILVEECPLDELQRVIRAAQREGDVDQNLDRLHRELRDARATEEESRRTLTLWSGSREELSALAMPEETTIDEFQRAFEKRSRQEDRIAEHRSAAETAREEARHQLATIERNRHVPSENALQAARDWRERGWSEIRRELEGRGAGPDRAAFLAEIGSESLVEGYEAAVRAADTIADRLRREAETVERIAGLNADESRAEADLERIARSEQTLRDERDALENQWRSQWSFLKGEPRSPIEMRAWSASLRITRENVTTTNRLEQESTRLQDLRRAHRQDLLKTFATLNMAAPDRADEMPLTEVLRLAEGVLADCQERDQQRRSLLKNWRDASDELVDIERRIEAAHCELDAANTEWAEWMASLGLAGETSNESALEVLEALTDVDKHRRDLVDRRQRIDQMKQDRVIFANDVDALVAKIAPDCAALPFEDALEEMYRRLTEARANGNRREDLKKRDIEAGAQLEERLRQVSELKAELRLCCQRAGCAQVEELPLVESRAARAEELDRQLEELRQELLDRSGGQSLEEFQQELDAANVDEIPANLARLASEIEQLTEQDRQALQEIGKLEQQLAAFGGGSEAADIADEIAAVRAKLARDVEHYARARIAARLLREGRERYRQKSGNALLDEASRIFSQLTGGAFEKLQVDYGESDSPTLQALRADGQKRVEPAGMSDGTRDQLYLALRIAWLRAWLDNHEPLPFVVDDLLIHFDDDRAAAALDVLAELSRRTQVIFFTHHDHLRELARMRIPRECLHEYELHSAFAENGRARMIGPPDKGRPVLEETVRNPGRRSVEGRN